MSERRPSFRFRLPWGSSIAAPQPTPAPRRTAQSQATTNSATQKPASKSAVEAPTKLPPSQIQPPPPPPPRTQPQPPAPRAEPKPLPRTQAKSSPPKTLPPTETKPKLLPSLPVTERQPPLSRTEPEPLPKTLPNSTPPNTKPKAKPAVSAFQAAAESRDMHEPTSQPHTVQIKAPPSPTNTMIKSQSPSVPSTSSRARSETNTISQSRSPLKQLTSKPQTPPRSASQSPGQLSSKTSTRPNKDTADVLSTIKVNSEVSSPLKKPQSTTKEQNQPQKKSENKSDDIVKSKEMSSTGDRLVEMTSSTAPDTETVLKDHTFHATPKSVVSPEKPKEIQEGKKIAEVSSSDENTNAVARKNTTHRATNKPHDAATGSGTDTEEEPSSIIQANKRNQKNQYDTEVKKTLTTENSGEKRIETVTIANPKDKNTINNAHQNPVTPNREQYPPHKEIKKDVTPKPVSGVSNKNPNEKEVCVLTLAGENRGATMNIGSESKKKSGLVHIHRGYKTKPNETPEATTTTDGEEENSKGKHLQGPSTNDDQPTKAYVNSNLQSVNNSIMFESSINERNPGVHLVFYNNKMTSTEIDKEPESLQTHNARTSFSKAEKHTHQPVIKRRCLRGLLMESSESDIENPEKPRRHGCRYK